MSKINEIYEARVKVIYVETLVCFAVFLALAYSIMRIWSVQ